MKTGLVEGCWKSIYRKSDRFYRVSKTEGYALQVDYIYAMHNGHTKTGTFWAGLHFRWDREMHAITEKAYFLVALRGG